MALKYPLYSPEPETEADWIATLIDVLNTREG